jgi:hypothetical protein
VIWKQTSMHSKTTIHLHLCSDLIYTNHSRCDNKVLDIFSKWQLNLPATPCCPLQSSPPTNWHNKPSKCATLKSICLHPPFRPLQVQPANVLQYSWYHEISFIRCELDLWRKKKSHRMLILEAHTVPALTEQNQQEHCHGGEINWVCATLRSFFHTS